MSEPPEITDQSSVLVDDKAARTGFTRRRFFKFAAVTGAVAALPEIVISASQAAATRLLGSDYASKFTKALPRPSRVDLTGSKTAVSIDVTQFTKQVLVGYPATKLYGYGVSGTKPSWPGPTLVAKAGKTVHATWHNKLPKGTTTLANSGYLLPVDASLLDDTLLALPAGEKPIITHLHGSHVEWQSDGYPEGWYTQSNFRGASYQKSTLTYDNSQVGGTLWYHDHTHGITRLAIFAGLAGMYLLRDTTETALVTNHVLPAPAYETELVIQDRWFTDDGQLFMNTTTTPENGIQASIFCDFMMVNGAAWPVMDVEPRKYRFRVVNGSDSRVYIVSLSSGAPMLVVGTELSLLPTAVAVSKFPLAPGERYDLVLDFTGLATGTEVILQNQGVDGILRGFTDGTNVTNRPSDTAFGFGGPTDPNSTGELMKFRVSKALTKTKNATVAAGTALGPALPTLTATNTRGVMTFNGTDGLGRAMEMLGSIDAGTAMWMDPVTEIVTNGTTEIWEIYNTGPVAHPIHLHLVDFQILDRASFTYSTQPLAMTDGGTGAVITVTGTGTPRGPESYEQGRKDTVLCYPGEVTRVVATFDRAGNYVWHCHILHHEDHDMMRPVLVQ